MKRFSIPIARQLLLGLIALQVLNLSIGNPDPWDGANYDYSYTYNKTYDPTESAVEWIVELKYGQQPGFSYNLHEDASKSPTKSLHWKTDLQAAATTLPPTPTFILIHPERPVARITTQPLDIYSPPPEPSIALA
jgi:hypothetical protein